MKAKLGPTGQFPEGKIHAHDDGELKFLVGRHQGNVVLDFGRVPVKWIAMPASLARELGIRLIAEAQILDETAASDRTQRVLDDGSIR